MQRFKPPPLAKVSQSSQKSININRRKSSVFSSDGARKKWRNIEKLVCICILAGMHMYIVNYDVYIGLFNGLSMAFLHNVDIAMYKNMYNNDTKLLFNLFKIMVVTLIIITTSPLSF